jgi:uridine kinase
MGVSTEALTLQQHLAVVVDSLARDERVLVAFDGPDAAGKTWLADSVAKLTSVPVVRASVDGFHNPAAVRLQRGWQSAEGCYCDYQTDRPRTHWARVGSHAALLVDGVFLLRPELSGEWTLRVYLHVPEHVTLTRALQRDRVSSGSEPAVTQRYKRRYLPAQAIYQLEGRPQDAAHRHRQR